MKKKEVVRIIKNQKLGDIKTFINLEELGAEIELESFIAAVSEIYGNPTFTLTKAAHKKALLEAIKQVIREMKKSTGAVAASNLSKL